MSNAPTTDQTHVTSTSSGLVRRSLLGMAAATVAALGLQAADAKKGGKGKGKRKGKGKGKGKGQVKVLLCHRNGSGFKLLSVGQPAVAAHEAHGDVVCAVGPCQTGVATGCGADGACLFALAAEGTACTLEDVAGVCSAEGECSTTV